MRRLSRKINLGKITIGGNSPVRVQSMTNTSTENIMETLIQIRQLYNENCEIIRLAVPNLNSVNAVKLIKQQLEKDTINIPIVADVHFSPSIALACVPYVDKIRINPGNFHNNFEAFRSLIIDAKIHGKAIRIGVNQGSLSKEILQKFGNTSEGMYQSLLPFLHIAVEENFENIVLSFKSSNVKTMIDCNREIVKKLDTIGYNFPIHLGVTEAGNGDSGRIKNAIGIGVLLLDGIGDTIRVSLTEDPVKEISAAYDILQSCNSRVTKPEYIACPSCGRTQFDIQKILEEIKEKTSHMVGIKIAVMGCVVNGIGEMADADFGYIGAGPGKINLYAHGNCIKTNIPEGNAIQELLNIIENYTKNS